MEAKKSKEIKLINESHFLSLRKKRNKKEYYEKKICFFKNIDNNNIDKINIDIKKIESVINKEKLYNIYINCDDFIQKIGYLLQMIITNDNNLIIYGIYNIKLILDNTNKTEFESKNLKKEFNENMFNYLFDIIDKKYKEINVLFLLVTIINKICYYDNQYSIIIINNLYKIIQIISGLNDNSDNNRVNIIIFLFNIINNIFLLENLNDYRNDLEDIGKELIQFIIYEIYNINCIKQFSLSKIFLSTLLTTLSNIFINKLFLSYIFKGADNLKPKEKNIFEGIKFIIKHKTNYELVDMSIFCLYNFIEFYLEIKDKLSEEDSDEINYRLCEMNIPKYIIPFIIDTRDNILNNDIKIYILKILINTILIGNSQYWSELIEKNLIEQILKLQNLFLSIDIDNNSINIFNYHLLLIFNLVSTEDNDVISELVINNPCISNLFKLFKNNNSFVNKQIDLFLNILHGLIMNQCKYRKRKCNFRYVKVFLLSEGICEFYKKLLLEEKILNEDLVKNIFLDLIALISYFNEFVKNDKDNIVLLHLQQIGINDIINHYESKINYSKEIICLMEGISEKLKF